MANKEKTCYYISTNGSDHSPGTYDQPFRTIERARDCIRALDKAELTDIHVYFREGLYNWRQTVSFDYRDSAAAGTKTTYGTYPGETVTISGGIEVKGWVLEEARSEGLCLWRTKVTETEYTRHLYVDGKFAPRPKSAIRKTSGWDTVKDGTMRFENLLKTVETFQGVKKVFAGYKTTNKEMASWRNPRDIEFVYDVGWTHSVCPVDEIIPDGDEAFIRMRMPCFKDCQIKGGVNIGLPNYMDNVFELMDEAGEWYFDRATKDLYYLAEAGTDINGLEIIIPRVERLLTLEGTLDAPLRNITFENLDFCHTTWLRPGQLGHAEVQSNLIKDPEEDYISHSAYLTSLAAIQFDYTHSVEVVNCSFHHLGGGAVAMQNGAKANRVSGNHIYLVSGSGIQLGGFTFKDAHEQDAGLTVTDNVVDNNYLHEIGVEHKGSIAIIAGYTERTVIRHNEISCAPYSGISVGWGWGYCDPGADERYKYLPPVYYPRFTEPTVCRNNRIEHNHIHHVMQALHDGSGIYTLSMQAGSVIKGNYIHHNIDEKAEADGIRYEAGLLIHNSAQPAEENGKYIKANGFPGGIYMDEASGGFEVSGNAMHDVVVPIHYHIVMDGRVETNSFHDNYYHLAPGDPGFPEHIREKAGLEQAYKHLLEKNKDGEDGR